MTPQTTDPRGNLPSASGLERVINCPGSVAAERGMPSLKEESYTADGTDIHKALETGDLSTLSSENVQIAEKLITLTTEAVQAWHEENNLDPANTREIREERFWIHNRRTLDPLASAQVDRTYINGAFALVIDFKTGFLGAPPAYVNAQLRTQAVAVRHEHEAVNRVRVAIAQARFKPTFDFCDYTEADLHAAENEIVVALWKSDQPNAPRFAGTWCKYCKANPANGGGCREAAALALIPTVVVPSQPPHKDMSALVSQLSHQDLAYIYARKSLADKIFKGVSERLKSLSAEELAKVGYELKPNRPTRSFNDLKALFAILKKEGYATADEFMSWCKIGIGDMEGSVARKIAAGSKITIKDAKVLFSDTIEPAATREPASPSLEPIK